jgi:glutamate dehydrogenase (NAD(P)+)
VKNLSHVRFGRLAKRYEEASFGRILGAVERSTGKRFNDADRRAIVHGPDEIDLVNSGLEETMIGAHQQIRDLARRDPRISDLRTAAFLSALTKVATSYLEMGIFP